MDNFTEMREAWIAAGRPADLADPYWRSVIESTEAPPEPVIEPLVQLG